MKHPGRRIIKTIEEENGEIPSELIGEVPNYKLIEDHNEAKQIIKSWRWLTQKMWEKQSPIF